MEEHAAHGVDTESLHVGMPRWFKILAGLAVGAVLIFLIIPLVGFLAALAGLFNGILNLAGQVMNWIKNHIPLIVVLVSIPTLMTVIGALITYAANKQTDWDKLTRREEKLQKQLEEAIAKGQPTQDLINQLDNAKKELEMQKERTKALIKKTIQDRLNKSSSTSVADFDVIAKDVNNKFGFKEKDKGLYQDAESILEEFESMDIPER